MLLFVDFLGERFIDTGRDHCDKTGKYRGSAHSNCNVNVKKTKYFSYICVS